MLQRLVLPVELLKTIRPLPEMLGEVARPVANVSCSGSEVTRPSLVIATRKRFCVSPIDRTKMIHWRLGSLSRPVQAEGAGARFSPASSGGGTTSWRLPLESGIIHQSLWSRD